MSKYASLPFNVLHIEMYDAQEITQICIALHHAVLQLSACLGYQIFQ